MDEHLENRGLTRGGLMKLGAAAALVAGAGAGGAGRALAGAAGLGVAQSGLRRPSGGPDYLWHTAFVPLVGTDFRIHRQGDRPLRVKLIEVKQTSGAGESFSLLFHGHAGALLRQDVHRIEHPTLGRFDLFVAPVGRGANGQDFEAVINRIAT